jgi:hypothetical protein
MVQLQLATGRRNGLKGGLARNPGGGPESRLWATVVERALGCANGESGKEDSHPKTSHHKQTPKKRSSSAAIRESR